ncbi:glycoside hydrolase family 2 TIM barrel-domain containing protein [Marinoscillum furvescens]|uniref:Beta-galactosidase n=1 Tax=Marinoscillum furvescens DSM 4134 TaxID=1122208 RepID=A0A3D9L2P1_MARFU|nr:glycoside hydrolase family 2 TIM barrel-domain containing protein [Marinoscillum furvescens]RED95962.1 beta-galactosidase [Marinoscillum furvescens DSM 4134]
MKMFYKLNVFLVVALLLIGMLFASCKNGQSTASVPAAEEEVSLNGIWKFYTIYGEGSNYMNIRQTESDLVVDNADDNVEVQGTWKVSTEEARGSKFHGKDYRVHYFSVTDLKGGNKADSSYVRFFPNFKKSGYYEVFTKYPFSSHLTAQYNIRHADGITTKYQSQRVVCGEWVSLGIYDFNQVDNNYVELTAIVSGAVAADAVMFREISEEKYLRAKSEPDQVYLKDFDDSEWYDLTVPGHWGMINGFSNYTGIGWYRKHIDLPASWQQASGKRYYLKFGGVYHLSKVYLNGQYIGMNRGGFTPFEFDVTDALNFDGENVIAVQADNSAIVGATWNWGGIIRDVTLTQANDVRIDYQYMHAEPNLETGSALLTLKVTIENSATEKRSIDLSSSVLDELEIATLSGSITLDPNSKKEIELQTTLTPETVELWHFDKPKLYQVQTRISENGRMLSSQTDHFGIRKVELTDSQMLLNGEPVRLAGFNRVSESRYWGSSEPLQVLERDVDLMKESGANFMRIMHGNQNEKLIELCDRKGILLFEEINVRDLDNDEFRANYYPVAKLEREKGVKLNSEEEEILMLDEPYVMLREEHSVEVAEKNYLLAKYWLKGMIERDINHPSIIGWSVGNELNNHFEYGREMIEYVKEELDPYRLVTCVSNSGQKEEYTPETDPNTFSDLIMHNMYTWQGQPQEILDALRTKWPDKPIFISEFGFGPYPTTGQDVDVPEISEWMNHYRHKNEYVIGTSMWTFNDYRSAYAGTTAEENRVWGVITTWREKRRLFDRIQREHAPVKDLEVSDIDFTNGTVKVRMPVRGASDYPSHTIRDYQLEYELRDTSGKIVYQNALDLPTITPDDEEWSGELTWTDLPTDILDLTLRLKTPTGYTRLAKTISFQRAITPQIREVIAGKNAARVFFDQVPNASEYYVTYTEGTESMQSEKTIADFIDITGLKTGRAYEVALVAVNDKGDSKPSEAVKVSLSEKVLPPIIWDAFITDGKLVIGYSSDFTDGDYTVRYGTDPDNLDKTFTSNVRGMMSIDLADEEKVYFQIKRNTNQQESEWSTVWTARASN